MTDLLTEVLDPTPGRAGDGRRAPGFRSIPPMSLHIGAMRDRRTRAATTMICLPNGLPGPNPDDEPHPPLSIVHELGLWVRVVVRDRGFRPPKQRTVPSLVKFLHRNLDWLTRQPWVDDIHRDLHRLVHQLRAATGEPAEKPVGHCIDLVGPESDRRYCGHPIYMPPDAEPRAPDEPIRDLPTLQCGSCGGLYSGARIIRLRMAEESKAAAG